MRAALDVRWALIAGIAYVYLVLAFYVGHELGRMESHVERGKAAVGCCI